MLVIRKHEINLQKCTLLKKYLKIVFYIIRKYVDKNSIFKIKNDILLNELTLTIKKIMILKVKLFRSSVRIWYTAHTLVIYSS